MIAVLSGLEAAVEVSALGIGTEEGGVLLGGHIEDFHLLTFCSSYVV
jgi:hypothetical protein